MHDSMEGPHGSEQSLRDKRRKFSGPAALAALLVGSSLAFASIRWSSPAQAGEPPRPSAANLSRGGSGADPAEMLDSGAQRLAIIAELKALRAEVASLRDLVAGGRAKVEVSNLDDLRLEIDYGRLRDALRGE